MAAALVMAWARRWMAVGEGGRGESERTAPNKNCCTSSAFRPVTGPSPSPVRTTTRPNIGATTIHCPPRPFATPSPKELVHQWSP